MNNVTAPKEYKLSKRSSYYIFTLLFLLYFFDYVDRMIVTSLDPFHSKGMGAYGHPVRPARVGGLLVHRCLCLSRFDPR